MSRLLLPSDCPNCGARVPRAAAGRCPSCRVDFTPALPGLAPARNRDQVTRRGTRIAPADAAE